MAGKRWGFALFAGLVLVLLVSGCTESGINGGIYQKIDVFNMSFSFSEHPRFNETTNLVITMRPIINLTGVRALVISDDKIELIIDSKLVYGTSWVEWNATINEGEEFQYNLPMKLIKPGDYSIAIQPEGMTTYRSDKPGKVDIWPRSIYFHVTLQEVITGNAPFRSGSKCTGTWEQVEQCMKTEARESSSIQ